MKKKKKKTILDNTAATIKKYSYKTKKKE